jgi:small subunit ribosomal protein S21
MTDRQYLYNDTSNYATKGGERQALEDHTPLQAKPLEVRVGDNFEKAFKIFRNMIQKERVISTYKEKQSFEKPSVKRRRKIIEAQRKRFETDGKRSRQDKSDKPRIKVLPETKQDRSLQ